MTFAQRIKLRRPVARKPRFLVRSVSPPSPRPALSPGAAEVLARLRVTDAVDWYRVVEEAEPADVSELKQSG